MQSLAFPGALLLAALLLTPSAHAAGPGPFGTGLDDTGARLSQDAVDPHYVIFGSTAFGPAAYVKVSGAPIDNGAWVDDSSASGWLVPDPDFFFADLPGQTDTIIYRTQFDLSAFSAPGWRIDGRWAADDSGLEIRLNGITVTGAGVAQADTWSPFTITSGLLPGLNTLEFVTFSTLSPTGLRVEMTTTPVPEPATWLLMGAGLGVAALRRRGSVQ